MFNEAIHFLDVFLEVDFALLAQLFSIHISRSLLGETLTYLPPKPQFLLLLALRIFFLGVLLARDFAPVEAGEVFFAGGGVEVDFLGGGDGDFALFGGRRHDS